MYLGELRHGSHVNERAHPPLIDAVTWQAAQYPQRVVLSHGRERALLARLVRCAGCSMTMSAVWHRNPAACGSSTIPAIAAASPAAVLPRHRSPLRALEPYVEECVFELLRRRRSEPAEDLARAEAALTSASAALTHYRDSDQVLRTIGENAYVAGMAPAFAARGATWYMTQRTARRAVRGPLRVHNPAVSPPEVLRNELQSLVADRGVADRGRDRYGIYPA